LGEEREVDKKTRPKDLDGMVAAVIETPKGSRNKYAHDPAKKAFKLSKVLAEGIVFPYDFGFVPSTKSPDGDPLDVLVLIDEPTFPGCILDCTLIGVMEAEQEEQGTMVRNDRLIAVATQSLRYADAKHIRDLNETTLKQIEAFFVNYQKLRNVELRILGRRGPDGALEILRKGAKQKHAA
jgi:inorganic pyrophosphatase